MRTIPKTSPPRLLTQWKAANAGDINYGYNLMRQDAAVREAVEDALLAEQGFLCAYTGMRIDRGLFHIEHLIPQSHCSGIYAG